MQDVNDLLVDFLLEGSMRTKTDENVDKIKDLLFEM